jgi:2-methylisocitrate lyase-like PEP mutase family enzyme
MSRIQNFRRLHESGCFVIPNPWDVGSARQLERLGFKALATTSSGIAWSLGLRDNQVPLNAALIRIEEICAATSLPVNADFEGGFAFAPEGVAENVRRALATGIAGISIEDSTGDAATPLFEFELAVERVRAAAETVRGTGVLLTARSEGFIVGRPDLDETLRRLRAFSDAGAECLYAPGLRDHAQIRAVVEAVSPKPVNALVGAGFATVAQLEAIGVRRISVGGALARAGWTGFLEAAREIAGEGKFERLGRAIPFGELDSSF